MRPWWSWWRWRTRRIKYSTVQNWYPGDAEGKGGIYNFVTKRGAVPRRALTDLLDAGGNRLGHHLEVPVAASCAATTRVGEFYSVAITEQPPAGRYRYQDDPSRAATRSSHHRLQGHLRRAMRSNAYRGLVRHQRQGGKARAISRRCDSLLIGDR
jgi:Fe-S cluster assembly protein SufB